MDGHHSATPEIWSLIWIRWALVRRNSTVTASHLIRGYAAQPDMPVTGLLYMIHYHSSMACFARVSKSSLRTRWSSESHCLICLIPRQKNLLWLELWPSSLPWESLAGLNSDTKPLYCNRPVRLCPAQHQQSYPLFRINISAIRTTQSSKPSTGVANLSPLNSPDRGYP